VKLRRIVTSLLAIQALGLVLLLVAGTGDVPKDRAIALMALGLVVIWVLGFGAVNLIAIDQLTGLINRIPFRWQLRFVVASAILALLEEAVTTSLSNQARRFGDASGEAMITASTNYLDVVLLNSVVVFIPMFVTWAWMLGKWRFTPFQVLICFGITGIFAELMMSGPTQLLGFGMWILVYGLMVYAPTKAVAPTSTIKPPFWIWPLTVVLPLFAAIPIALSVLGIRRLFELG
jgi:hypothetical protein